MGNKEKGKKKKVIKDMGEKFFLEQWEIYDSCNLERKNSNLKFDKNLLVSQIKRDPFEDYTEIETIGEGSFGRVILVEHNITGMKRAMKQIKKSLFFQESNEESVLNELNILKKIDHQNVVKVFDYYIDNVNYYIITEYCAGGDLFDAVKDIELSEYEVALIMYQILLAVNHLHKMNIMHRDLKPENILVSKKEENGLYRIKLCDFGTSHLFKEGKKEKTVKGSSYYIAPEVYNQKYDFKCDLWSCGVIMYVLLTKKIPFYGNTKKELRENIINQNYITEPLMVYSSVVRKLIDDLLEKDYDKRINAETALNYKFFQCYKCKDIINQMNVNIINKYIENIKKYKQSNIFQETAITYLIHNVDLDEVSEAYKLFNIFDDDRNGKIDFLEFYNGLCSFTSTELDKEKIREVFYNIDVDNNNYIEQEEFIKAAIDKRIFLSENMLKFAFNFFDVDKSGTITIEKISALFKEDNSKNEKEATEELKNIIKSIDKNDDGEINFEEFSQLMKSLLNNL